MLSEVQGNNVYCLDPAKIGSLLLGPEGTQVSVWGHIRRRLLSLNGCPTQVELGFMRSISFPTENNYRVTLTRAPYSRAPQK